MTTVAVTGATGFIGRHVVTQLLESGVHVRAVVRRTGSLPLLAGATIVTTPLERAPLVTAFQGADVIVHLAGVVSTVRARDYVDVNVEGTRAVAEAARIVDARLIHISSLSVAGPATAAAPSTEDDPPNPITPYGLSKVEAERIVRSTPGLRWTILRPAIVYGPGDRGLLPLFQWAERGIVPLVGRRDAAYTFVHVKDVSRAIAAALGGAAEGQVLFVGHPRIVTAVELAEAVRAALGGRPRLVRLPRPIVWVAAVAGEAAGRVIGRPMPLNLRRVKEMWAPGFICRVDRMRERLGVVATIDLGEGLSDAVAWYRRHGWL